MNITSIFIKMILLLGVLAASFFGGWKVESWHDGSKRADMYKQSIDSERQSFNRALNERDKMDQKVADLDQKSQDLMSSLNILMENQKHGFQNIYYKLGHVPLGVCNFTTAADGLFRAAYDTAFSGIAMPKTSQADATNGKHAAPAYATTAHEPPPKTPRGTGSGSPKAVH